MWRDAWTVASKELRDLFRDRRTVLLAIALPIVLLPMVMHLSVAMATDEAEEAASKTARIALLGGPIPDPLRASLDRANLETADVEGQEQARAQVQDETLDAAIVVQPQPSGQLQLVIHYDNTGIGGKTIVGRIDRALDPYREQVRGERFAAVGVTESADQAAILEPVAVDKRGVAGLREAFGAAGGWVLPYLFMFLAYLGAQWPATDLGAGEKERGTLEALLLAPISRNSLVLGKFVTVAVFASLTALAGLAGIGLWMRFGLGDVGAELQTALATFGALDLVLCGVLLLPLTVTIAALLLSASFYARSFKETQSMSGMLLLPLVMLVLIAQMPGLELDGRWAWVPVTNASLAIKEVIKGTAEPGLLALVIVTSGGIAAGLLVFCVQWFQRESVLFRS